jgi:hypothetical protein
MVYAQLIHSQLAAVLNFLSSVPGPTGESGLHFVLAEWVARQHVFYGAYENKVSILALVKLLQYGVSSNDARLQEINVKGDEIIVDHGARRMTRSARKQEPLQWTNIPVLAKMFKLIVNEMTNSLDALAQGDDEDDDDDVDTEEDEWDEEDGGGDADHAGENGMTSAPAANGMTNDLGKLLDPAFNAYFDDDDEEEDPDAKADPVYSLNLKQYLTEFLHDFCKQPYFPHFSQHLNVVERSSLQSIGITVL